MLPHPPSSPTSYVKRLTPYGMVCCALAYISCSHVPDGAISNHPSVAPDSAIPTQITVLADLPDSLQPQITVLNQVPAPTVITSFTREKKKISFAPDLQNYTVKDGLAADAITCSYVDNAGNLWFGTHAGGVSKFDGTTFTNYSTTCGLASLLVRSIMQDRKGIMWFATGNGISKFDGTTFTTFANIQLPLSLFEDKQGGIWIGTHFNGLYYCTADSIIHYGPSNGLTGKVISSIQQDSVGTILIGSYGGLFSFDSRQLNSSSPVSHKFIKINSDNITFLHVDRHENIWTHNEREYTLRNGYYSEHFPAPDIAAVIIDDHAGNILFTNTKHGIWEYNASATPRFRQRVDFPQGDIRTMIVDHSGNVWFGTNGNGIFKYPGQAFQQLTTHSIRTIMQDQHEDLWMSGYNIGLARFDGESFTTIGARETYMSNWGIARDSINNFWLASENAGLIKYDHQSLTFYTPAQGLANITTTCLLQATDGNLWIGTQSGISKFDGRTITTFTKKQGLAGASVSAMLENQPGRFYFGTDKGLSYYDGQSITNFMIHRRDGGNDIKSIARDAHGNLWLGLYGGGLSRYDGTSFKTFTTEHGLPDNVITQVITTRSGHIAIGTNKGFALLTGFSQDPHRNLKHAGTSGAIEAHPAQNTVANSALNDFQPVFEIYNPQTGYPVMDVNRGDGALFEDSHGVLWVASGSAYSGVMRFDYNALHKNDTPPRLFITGIKVDNETICWQNVTTDTNSSTHIMRKFEKLAVPAFVTEEIIAFGKTLSDTQRADMRHKFRGIRFDSISKFYPVPQNLVLPYAHNQLTLEFAAVEPGNPSLIQYQYKLEGYDKNWSTPANITRATYGNIDEGTYRFFIKAQSPSGVWSEPITYSFTVLPPAHRTWWAYTLYVLLLVALMYGILQMMKRRLHLQHQRKAEQDETIRLKELDTFKSQLFTNLTHEFRTPLTVILGMAKQLTTGTWQSVVGQKEKTRVERGLQLIEKNGQNLLQLINQLLDLSKLENKSFKLQLIQSDIIQYLRYVTESFQSLAEQVELSLRFTTDMKEVVMDFDPEQIKQVMTNLVSNALKFTPSGGEVIVSVTALADQLEILVKDTGIGISQNDLPHILDRFYQADRSTTRVAQGTGIGLAHTQELLNVMNGSISIDSELDIGTSVCVRLPIQREATVIANDDIASLPTPFIPVVSQHQRQQVQDLHPLPGNGVSDTGLPQLLIIEDNRDVVMYLRSCLEDVYEVAVAYDGNSGVDLAFESVPDLIISDVMMPGLDGFQVCDRVKNDERTSHIPIILLTAKADAASRLTGLRRGADAYMSKPFSPDELSLQITTLLDNRRRVASHFSKHFQPVEPSVPLEAAVNETIRFEHPFIKKINGILEEYYSNENFGLPELCDKLSMSRIQLFRKLKAMADTSPSDLIRSYRLSKAKVMLESGEVTVSEAAYQSGFRDPSYFSKLFQEEFGVQPSAIYPLAPKGGS